MILNSEKNLNILLIEDNLGDQLLIHEYLYDALPNSKITNAANFKDGKKILSDKKTSLNLILLDLTLPDLSREDLLNEIIAISGKIPIIILTGYEDVAFATQALSMGFSDYLIKDDLNEKLLYKSIAYSFERKHIDSQLNKSVQRYQELFQLNPQPLFVVHTINYEILEVNKAAIEKYGYNRDEFLSMSMIQICNSFDKNKSNKDLLHEKELKKDDLHQHTLKNGHKIWVKMIANELNYQGLNALLILALDVTEIESHITKIENQNNKLKDIAWQQSHLVRSPLTRMMGLMDRIEKKYHNEKSGMSEELKFLMKHVFSSAHEIDDLIRYIVNKTSEKEDPLS